MSIHDELVKLLAERCVRSASMRRAIRADVKSIRTWLLLFAGWPRDARAWARRDRIEALLSAVDTAFKGPLRRVDAVHLHKTILELLEWMRRDRAFIRDYPLFDPPSDWTRRELSPSIQRKIRRAWGALVPQEPRRLPKRSGRRKPKTS